MQLPIRAITSAFGLAVLVSLAAIPAPGQKIDPRDRDFWNGVFNDPAARFNHQPNRWLVEAIHGRTPGSALDLGMGQGRNAIYLAQQGWQVTGVDLADVAVAQARQRAAQLKVKLNAVVQGLDDFDIGRQRWDLIALFYMHAWYHSAKPSSVTRILEGLKPGGILVMEGFAGDESFMFHANELLRDFGDLRILRYEDVEDEADWSPGEKSHIIRLVAVKPIGQTGTPHDHKM